MAPRDRSELLDALYEAIACALQSQGVHPGTVRVLAVDRGIDGHYAPLEGQALLLDDPGFHGVAGGQVPATLLVGLASEHDLRATLKSSGSADALLAMLDWPGLLYLPYGFDAEQLADAARRARAGSNVPFSAAALWSCASLLRLCHQVRHWAKGRLATTEGAALIYVERAQDGQPLHRALVAPLPALTDAHQVMLSRLLDHEGAYEERRSPPNPSRRPIADAVAGYQAAWSALEAQKARVEQVCLRASGVQAGGRSALLLTTADQGHMVCESLEVLIAAIETFERRVRAEG